ncbi:MAG: hypothetical protein ACP5I1_00690 [Candidatus Hinthialibacter sp.]
MKTRIMMLMMFFLPASLTSSQELTLSNIFHDSFTFFQLLRQDNGVYRDALRFDGNHFHPASISATGMGLISLCIADEMGWITNAEHLAETTLQTVTGKNPPFTPDRNASGYFRHWLNLTSGAQAWNSEYSTIDTAILAAGANFCSRYFQSPSIQSLFHELWASIDWTRSIADPAAGKIYLELNEDGSGKTGSVTAPFSEYMLVAWLAMKKEQQNNEKGPASELWNRHYAHPENLPKTDYKTIPLLTDQPGRCLSHFTLQFAYYLCHDFTMSAEYMQYLNHARNADQLWWSANDHRQENEWGLGAGSVAYSPGYHADAINNNRGAYISPHIIAGFLPVYKEGVNDLAALLTRKECLYKLPGAESAYALWRISAEDRTWKAPDIQGVDYALMLFGLASLPDFLGSDFFPAYNDLAAPLSVNRWDMEKR